MDTCARCKANVKEYSEYDTLYLKDNCLSEVDFSDYLCLCEKCRESIVSLVKKWLKSANIN